MLRCSWSAPCPFTNLLSPLLIWWTSIYVTPNTGVLILRFLSFHGYFLLWTSMATYFKPFCVNTLHVVLQNVCSHVPHHKPYVFYPGGKGASGVWMWPAGAVWISDKWKISHLLAIKGILCGFIILWHIAIYPTYQSKKKMAKIKKKRRHVYGVLVGKLPVTGKLFTFWIGIF